VASTLRSFDDGRLSAIWRRVVPVIQTTLELAAWEVGQGDSLRVFGCAVPPEEAADARQIKIPLQGHFAKHDEFFPPDQVEAMESRLKEGDVSYEFYWYDAQYAFGNETLKRDQPDAPTLANHYNPEAARLA
jgi:dienelactone hydrolase